MSALTEAVEAVLALTYASDDGTEYEHNGHAPHEGEPECPGCWVAAIRPALARVESVVAAERAEDRARLAAAFAAFDEASAKAWSAFVRYQRGEVSEREVARLNKAESNARDDLRAALAPTADHDDGP